MDMDMSPADSGPSKLFTLRVGKRALPLNYSASHTVGTMNILMADMAGSSVKAVSQQIFGMYHLLLEDLGVGY
jgi:hypothetical protein